MKETLKKTWQFLKKKGEWTWKALNGNKRDIGIVLWLAGKGIQVFLPSLLNQPQTEFIQTVGMVMMGVGELHSIAKKDTTKKLLGNIVKQKKQ